MHENRDHPFARVDAAIGMKVEDVYVQGGRTWVRLHEMGGNVHGKRLAEPP